MTSALPAGSSLDTGGVPPLEALFDKGWPASEIHFLPHRTQPQLKPRLKQDGLEFPNPINQLRLSPRPEP
jgi:hypothetical protein